MADPSHSEVLSFVKRNSQPFVTSKDVAEQFGEVSDRTVRERLHDLVDQGELKMRKVGAHAKVWYLED